ncbi:phage portal protein [Gemella sp. GH3]|uniref:phage portal protein n=1 Tax=unclassified Gemella TaxID=2624949 RepID=UPI0015D05EFE|nr:MULTISPECIES: phage portal protein [unclassified Gemella]MBF0714503.1 phage portal protein [Gemella sp. GH3.1]NYS51455.1 phage portal protein [Gemella sp. GH3]
MSYSEQFVDSTGKTKNLSMRFHRESRLRYRISSVEELTPDVILKFVQHHRNIQRPRIQELYDYSEGNNHNILDGKRRSEEDMADNRLVHNFGKAISVFKQGYLVGNPILVEYDDGEENSNIDQVLKNIAKVNNFHNLNRSLVLDLSRVGRAYDLVYRSDKDVTTVRRLNPLDTFLIYDTTLDDNVIAGIRYYSTKIFEDSKNYIELYTESRILKFDETDMTQLAVENHSFGVVPITEYLNTSSGMGDYESELSLIDSYDTAESDTANYMTDLSDAILGIFGDVEMGDGSIDDKIANLRKMRKARLLQIKPPQNNVGESVGNVDAKYLYKQYDVSGVESYKTRIVNDIHKFTNTPDMTDDNFGGVQSGEAMKYKLFGLEQERVDTQALFESSLRRRYQLIANIGGIVKEIMDFNISNLKITFTPNLPKSLQEKITAFKELGGMVSNETAMRLTAIVDDPTAEIEKLEEKQSDDYDSQKNQFNSKKAYAIQSILLKLKREQITRNVALKLFADLGISEYEAEGYIDDGVQTSLEGVLNE